MTEPKDRRGGRRAGSGRKPLPQTQKRGRKQKLIQTSLPDDILVKLDERASVTGSTRAAVMREIIVAALRDS